MRTQQFSGYVHNWKAFTMWGLCLWNFLILLPDAHLWDQTLMVQVWLTVSTLISSVFNTLSLCLSEVKVYRVAYSTSEHSMSLDLQTLSWDFIWPTKTWLYCFCYHRFQCDIIPVIATRTFCITIGSTATILLWYNPRIMGVPEKDLFFYKCS